jgi:glycosyltransferase involved in cell wall biosynthesis
MPLEIIVVDDGSTEPVDLTPFEGENIHYLPLARNSGPQVARNKGIEAAKGQWIVMLDDDDELISDTLQHAISRIREVEDHEGYPVFFFATTKGHLSKDFVHINTIDILNGTLKGDFTPVIRRSVFLNKGYRYHDYPEILGVGCELLTWLDISTSFAIPAFNYTLVKVNEDAPLRLTSYENFIRNSDKFALQQDITIRFLRERHLDVLSPVFLNKKFLGAATYYLISGNRKMSRERLQEIRIFLAGKVLVYVLSFLPLFLSKVLFRYYKLRFSK